MKYLILILLASLLGVIGIISTLYSDYNTITKIFILIGIIFLIVLTPIFQRLITLKTHKNKNRNTENKKQHSERINSLLNNKIIEDEISGTKVILSKESISNGYTVIDFNDVFDFNFEHSYHTLNGITRGEVAFNIYSTKNNIIQYRVSAGSFHSKKKSEDNINKVTKLFERIFPYIMESFLRHSIKSIEKRGVYEVSKIKFKRDGIYMNQRVYYWLNEVYIPYHHAEIEGNSAKWGLLYSGGTSTLLRLINTKTGESYKYSRNIHYQPNSIEILKAQQLLRHIILNELFNVKDNTYESSKKL